jgi:hypothetical protein
MKRSSDLQESIFLEQYERNFILGISFLGSLATNLKICQKIVNKDYYRDCNEILKGFGMIEEELINNFLTT